MLLPTSNIIAEKDYHSTSTYTMSNNKLVSEIWCLSCDAQDSRSDTPHKKPSLDQDSLKNYRPVSNLAFTGKLIEKVVLRRLSKHMSDHDLGEPLQSAYRPKHSPETALMKVQHDISDQLDKGRSVALVLLDLSAAFDTINSAGVINTLEHHIGVKGVALV